MYSRVRCVASMTRFWRIERSLDRQANRDDVRCERDGPVDGLTESIVVLPRELDAHEVLDVHLLHRAEVLHAHGDVVQRADDPILFTRVVESRPGAA